MRRVGGNPLMVKCEDRDQAFAAKRALRASYPRTKFYVKKTKTARGTFYEVRLKTWALVSKDVIRRAREIAGAVN